MKNLNEINQCFAYIQQGDVFFQELIFDEDGNATGWDEEATAAAYYAYLKTLQEKTLEENGRPAV